MKKIRCFVLCPQFWDGLALAGVLIHVFAVPLAAEQVSAPFTDHDGDTYLIKLSGPGNFEVTRIDQGGGDGPLDAVTITGTTEKSRLSLTVTAIGGDGKVAVNSISGDTPLKSIFAGDADLAGSGIALPGGVGSVRLGSIGDGAAITSGENADVNKLTLTARTIGTGVTINCPAQTLKLTAASVAGVAISAGNVAQLKITEGGFAGSIQATGKIVAVNIKGGDLTAVLYAPKIGPIAVKKAKAGAGGNVTDATIAAAEIGPIKIAGDVRDSMIIAGMRLGADGLRGGTGVDADTFSPGKMKSVKIGGDVIDSIIGAGYSPFDGIFANGNDGIFGDKASKLGKITIRGTLSDSSRLGAGKFSAIKIGGNKFKPGADPRFVTRQLIDDIIVPPDPGTLAPTLDPTTTTPLIDAIGFLFTGNQAIQTGVQPGTIEPARVAVLRGKIRVRDGGPLSGVLVTALAHPEYGQTFTRADGAYDLVVNGGGPVILSFKRDGFMPLQRQVEVALQDFSMVDETVMVEADPVVSTAEFGAASPMQVHEATMQNDASGARHAMLMFQPGTSASLVMGDGSLEPMGKLNIRATEFTVGTDGPAAMPAQLPPNSAYTYCVDLTADEALAAGATSVEFDRPVYLYLENFLHFESGIEVPSGFYNAVKGVWEAGPNGRIITILDRTAGRADLDVNGDGIADTDGALSALNITDEERVQLASSYANGQSLWRVPIPHFSPWDCNWAFGPPPDAEPPSPPPPRSDNPPNDPDDPPNVYLQSQAVGEHIELAGVPFGLNYRSERAAGRKEANRLQVPLSGATLPGSVKRIEMEVSVAGRSFVQEFPAVAGQTASFAWNGLDAYERAISGRQPAQVRIGYVYDGDYTRTNRFGYTGNGVAITGDKTRSEITLSTTRPAFIGASDIRPASIGGWTFEMHHYYDPITRKLYLGDGTSRDAESVNAVISTAIGSGLPYTAGFNNDGIKATDARLPRIAFIEVAADGSVFFSESFLHQIFRVDPAGILHVVAGIAGQSGYNGDEQPATTALLAEPFGIALAPDGTIFFNDGSNRRTRSITPDGMIHTVAGTGADGYSGDGGPAIVAQTGVCVNLSRAADGSLFISDSNKHAIRRVGTDGIITTVAGSGVRGFSGDGGPATAAMLSFPLGVELDADGNLFIADAENRRIRKVGTDGIITTICGDGTGAANAIDMAGDGGPAVLAKIGVARPGFQLDVNGLHVDRDGNVVFSDVGLHRIRRIGRDGIITSVAGSGLTRDSATSPNGDRGAALQARLGDTASAQGPVDLAVAPDGTIYISDFFVRRVAPPLPGFSGNEIVIPSEDGSELYRFDATGRHLSTVNAFTGGTIFTFSYDGNGQLVTVRDGGNNATTIQRNAAGAPTAIVAPFGHQTTLSTDANGSLTSVRSPLGGVWSFGYTPEGLLLTETDPVGHHHTFTYDEGGRLTKGTLAGGYSISLERVEIPDGYFVETSSALGAEGSFRIEEPSGGGQLRTNTASTGLVTTSMRSPRGINTTAFPGGTTETITLGPDPRFGFQAPVDAIETFATPGGKALSTATTRNATLTDPDNVLDLTAYSETTMVNGASFDTVYDPKARTFTNRSATGRESVITLDPLARLVESRFGDRTAQTFTYDAESRLTAFSTGVGAEARRFALTYNVAGQLDEFTDPLGQTQRYTYDADGRVTQRRFADGGELLLEHDAVGNIVALTPPGRTAHRFSYAPDGSLATYTAPGGGTTAFTIDTHHALTQLTEPGGVTVAYGYDAAGRPISRTVAAGVTTFSYDPNSGELSKFTTPGGDALNLTHDGPFELSATWTGAVAGSVSRTLDNHLRTATQSVNGSGAVTFTYDADSLLATAGPLTLTRHPQREVVAASTLGGVTDSRTFNEFGALAAYSASFNGNPLFSLSYTYDRRGRVTQAVETVAAGTTDTFDYSYDAVGRLLEVRKNGAEQESYTYDLNGNRLTNGGSAATYDAEDRLTQFGPTTFNYAPRGNLISKVNGGQTSGYTYDALGNLIAVTLPDGTIVEYLSDGRKSRIGRKVNGAPAQGFIYQDPLNILGELDGANNLVSRFVYAESDDVPSFMFRGGETFRLLSDRVGTVRLVVNTATGVIAQRLDYSAFGEVLVDTNPGFQPFGFAGGLYDPLTGLVRFGARDYDATIGRWTAKDPLLLAGRDPNLYAYARNDPVNSYDPEGLDIVSVGTYTAGFGIPGHSSISVNGAPFQGFYPDHGGAILPEGHKLKRNPEYRVRFKVTPEQARRIKKFIEDQKKKGREFNLFTNNCSNFVRDALAEGGVLPPGHSGFTPGDLFLETLEHGGNFGF